MTVGDDSFEAPAAAPASPPATVEIARTPAPAPASAAPAARAIPVAVRSPINPLSTEGERTCSAWRTSLQEESRRIDLMDAQVASTRRSLDTEEAALAAERAAVDTRFLQQVKDYGKHVEDNRRRTQAWNQQVDAYNARVVAWNSAARTYQSGCALRMNDGSLQAARLDTAPAARKP